MAEIKFYSTTSNKVDELPIKTGQLIFVRDSRTICMDYNDERIVYSQIIYIDKDSTRLSIARPLTGFYFVKETNILWRYDEEWIALNESPKSTTIFCEEELPDDGQSNMLYITNDSIYRWANNKFVDLSGKCQWDKII